MEAQMLEARVIAIVDAVQAGRQVEDDRVELKASWPNAEHKTARQIAGHANASGGEPILWIIGLDEKSRRFGSTSGTEPADWWGAVRKHFVEVSPEMKVLTVPVASGRDVVALQFSTDRAQYVVGVVGGGHVQREVPWREGNATRTAHRHELIRTVVEEAVVPVLQLVGGLVEVQEFVDRGDPYEQQEGYDDNTLKVECALNMFLSARGTVHLPEHRQTMTVETSRGGRVDLGAFELSGSYRLEGSSQVGVPRRIPFGNVSILGRSGVEVTGPGELRLRGRHVLSPGEGSALLRAKKVHLNLDLPVDMSARSVRLACRLDLEAQGAFRERDIPDISDRWATRRRFVIGETPTWWA